MPKFFCISDVHGFYNEMKAALNEAGFDPSNEDHWLISCGDNWDRGSQPYEVMQYLKSLPRKILVKGNHEQLFVDCCERGEAYSHDYSNGTFKTICDLGGFDFGYTFAECCDRALARTQMFLNSMVNYFETKNYIFCHGFIPVHCDDHFPPYYRRGRKFRKMDNWREATQYQWDDAMWLNSYEMVDQGFGTDKTIIAGHWHASYGRYQRDEGPEFGEDADFSPFYYDDKLIMIDACTAYSGKVNCLVVEDDFINGESS